MRLQGLHDQVEELLKYRILYPNQSSNPHILYSVLKRIEKSMEERAKQSLRHRIVHQLSDADEITRFHKELTLAYKSFMVGCYLFRLEIKHTDSPLHHALAGIPTACTERHLTARCCRILCDRHHRSWRPEAGYVDRRRCPRLYPRR